MEKLLSLTITFMIASAFATLSCDQNVKYNTHGEETCQGKNCDHGSDGSREDKYQGTRKSHENTPVYEDTHEHPNEVFGMLFSYVGDVHVSQVKISCGRGFLT
jgi:hypothetical protein